MIANMFRRLIFLIIMLARGGQSLKCWSCSSIYEPSCDDPFKPKDLERSSGIEFFLLDCNHDAIMNGSLEEQHLMEHVFGPEAKTHCRKTVRKAYGITVVIRGCSFGDSSKYCSEGHGDCDSTACFEDGCNAAASPTRIAFLFTTTGLLLSLH